MLRGLTHLLRTTCRAPAESRRRSLDACKSSWATRSVAEHSPSNVALSDAATVATAAAAASSRAGEATAIACAPTIVLLQEYFYTREKGPRPVDFMDERRRKNNTEEDDLAAAAAAASQAAAETTKLKP